MRTAATEAKQAASEAKQAAQTAATAVSASTADFPTLQLAAAMPPQTRHERRQQQLAREFAAQQQHAAAVRDTQQRSDRAQNVFVRGLPEPNDEEQEKDEADMAAVRTLLALDEIDMMNVAPESTRRVGRADAARPRGLVVRLPSTAARNQLLRSAHKLARSEHYSTVYVGPDHTPAEAAHLALRRRQCKQRNEAEAAAIEEDASLRWVVYRGEAVQKKELPRRRAAAGQSF